MVRIGDYCKVVKGKIGIKKAVEGEYPLVTTAEERLSHNEFHFDRPSVIIPVVSSTGHGHASIKRIHYQEGQFAVGSILAVVTPKDISSVSALFLFHYLDLYKEQLLVSQMKGMANVTLSIKAIENVNFPLMSFEQQLEWVDLFTKVKKYTGGLSSEISNQQVLLKKLRQQTLQDAISGKLTAKWREDNPDVEPTSALLSRIQDEKERLVNEKKIKKQKPLPPISEEEIPFDLPDGWCWCRLGDLCDIQDPNPSHRMPQYIENGIPFISTKDVDEYGTINFNTQKQVLPKVLDEHKDRYSILPHSFAFTRIGTIGKVFKLTLPQDYCLSHSLVVISPYDGNEEFFMMLMSSLTILYQAKDGVTHNTVPDLGIKTIKNFCVPISSSDEIDRIVGAYKEAHKILDELETQSFVSHKKTNLLMQAVLKEAFTT